jgi:uncharacterized protein (TIGR02271 family)
MESDTYGRVTDWNEVIKKEARGSDNADLGKVQEVNKDFIITERGTITKEMFYLPKSIPHGYNGRILLFHITEKEAKEKFIVHTTPTASGSKIQTRDFESPIPVIEERMEVSKKDVMVEAKIIKRPLKDTKVVEVELTHEELIIEKRSVSEADKMTEMPTTPPGSSSSQEITQSKTEINIPLKREDVVISKKPYVKEEIVIKKKSVTETKMITEQVTTEKLSTRSRTGEQIGEEVNTKRELPS